ncbi:hypothetical protein G7027_04690 [Pseudomonas japonica]|nr:hypothetical protein [Pseudomonas japonica]
MRQVAKALGFTEDEQFKFISTPIGPIQARRDYLLHIVQKRANARERFAHFAAHTLSNPLEVWQVMYDDKSFRLSFIGAYPTKYQMLVIINVSKGHMLWNYMNCDKKSLNKHRAGQLVYACYKEVLKDA